MYKNKRLKSTKTLVIEIFQAHPDWNGKQVYDRYLEMIEDPKQFRTLNAIQKQLEKIKPIMEQIADLDKKWHLGTLKEHNIPAEAVPYILMVQDYAENYPDPVSNKPQDPVTIRQVTWISRLYSIVAASGFKFKSDGLFFKSNDKEKLKAASFLYDWSKVYATHEIACKLSNSPFNTTGLDKALRKGDSPHVVGQQWIINHDDNSAIRQTVRKE